MLGKTARAVTGASVVAAPTDAASPVQTDAATAKTLLTQRKAPQPCQQLNLTCGVEPTAVRQTINKPLIHRSKESHGNLGSAAVGIVTVVIAVSVQKTVHKHPPFLTIQHQIRL